MNFLRGTDILLVAITLFWGAAHAFGEERDPTCDIQAAEKTFHQSLQRYQQEGDYVDLFAANRAIATLSYNWQHNKQVHQKTFEMNLDLLDLTFSAHDETYDLKNPPPFSTKVSPGLGPGLWPGMDPEAIKDPELRKRYEEDVAENNRRRAKHRHEKIMREFIDPGLEIIQGRLKTDRETGEMDKTIATIRARIKNPVLLKKIEDEMLATSETEKKEWAGGCLPIQH